MIKPSGVGEKNLWLLKLVDQPAVAANLTKNSVLTEVSSKGLCVVCKGSRNLCGKARCPLLVRVDSYLRTFPLIQSTSIDGISPPSVFVGRIGYPKIYAGPLVPPVYEDTRLYDLPELWFGKPIEEIVHFRSMLVRGKHRVHVKKFGEAGKIIDKTRELALSERSVDTELELKNKPRHRIVLDDQVQPFGPSAPIRKLQVGTTRWNHQIEKAYYDTDLLAADAVTELHKKGVFVTKIQRAFSVGAFGLKENRRLVPTRWSITAVDSIISKELMNKIKMFPEINEYRVYESRYLDRQLEILMIPAAWSYEIMETWYPGTTWNPAGTTAVMFSDWEGYGERTTYASIGGCYYAARLAVCEQLLKERRQATVIVLCEAHPGYIMPVGVWQVRENVRNAVKQPPLKFNTLQDALKRIGSQLQIPMAYWIQKSKLLESALFQKRLTNFFST
ncbi:MAG: Nre family DNA repair protein [Thermoproteota archaeon]|nr:Nre family DNA repair protein [Thermoproteota archaeon]